jgi:hypothetical protein
MAGLVPAIHVFRFGIVKTWMPGKRPGMTIVVAARSATIVVQVELARNNYLVS